ncbi:MAG: DUF6273 domain-containing protein [Lachnospiraceae bacterium]|nr:DUF6273 domain-containing protein [Lachnospiraceae bacterium]
MAVAMYKGEPLSGQIPNIAIDLFDKSLKNLAPSYLTYLLNQKIMNGLTAKAGTTAVSKDNNTITCTYDDGTKEVLVKKSDTVYTVTTYDRDGNVLQSITNTVDLGTGKIRTDTSVAGMVNGIVPFATASWDEIAIMLKRHYAGVIDIADYWSIGDTKQIHFNTMEAQYVGENHGASTQLATIIGFNHDDMTNGGKAAVTIQFMNSVGNAGYIHGSATNAGGWRDSARRNWCNHTFFGALDVKLQELIKPVDKMCSLGRMSTQLAAASDKVFLLSESEVVGFNIEFSVGGEGTQYPYFQGSGRQCKKQSDNSVGCDNWFTRSPAKANPTQYVYFESDGEGNTGDASNQYRIIPAFCI